MNTFRFGVGKRLRFVERVELTVLFNRLADGLAVSNSASALLASAFDESGNLPSTFVVDGEIGSASMSFVDPVSDDDFDVSAISVERDTSRGERDKTESTA